MRPKQLGMECGNETKTAGKGVWERDQNSWEWSVGTRLKQLGMERGNEANERPMDTPGLAA